MRVDGARSQRISSNGVCPESFGRLCPSSPRFTRLPAQAGQIQHHADVARGRTQRSTKVIQGTTCTSARMACQTDKLNPLVLGASTSFRRKLEAHYISSSSERSRKVVNTFIEFHIVNSETILTCGV